MNQYLFSTRLRFHAIMLALVLPVVTVHAECAWPATDSLPASFRLLGIHHAGRALLRWAPEDFPSWQRGIQQGYILERYTMLDNGDSLSETQTAASRIVLAARMLPQPVAVFEQMSDTSNAAGVAGAALYEPNVEVTVSTGDAFIRALSQAEQNDSRFGLGLVAADASFPVAEAMALGYTDPTVAPNSVYEYRIAFYATDSALAALARRVQIDTRAALTLPALPVPALEAGAGTALLSWSSRGLDMYYRGYDVERSADGGATWQPRNSEPVLPQESESAPDPTALLYIDTLESAETTYQYRLRGHSIFGVSATGEVAAGKSLPAPLAAKPELTGIARADGGKLTAQWTFPSDLEDQIQGFQVYRSPFSDGPFEAVGALLPASERAFTDGQPRHTNYYLVKAVDLFDREVESISLLGQPEDRTPPVQVSGLSGSVTPLGAVSLQWTANPDDDLYGYRVYRAGQLEAEYVQVSEGTVSENAFSTQIAMNTLAEKAYFRVRAVDFRDNLGALSDPLELALPDVMPPAPPHLASVEPVKDGVKAVWSPSPSEDVTHYEVQRRSLLHPAWIPAATIAASDTLSAWQTTLDTELGGAADWEYRVVATDEAGLTGISPTLRVTLPNPRRAPADRLKAETTIADKKMVVKLSWEYPYDPLLHEFAVYRSDNGGPMRLVRYLELSAFPPVAVVEAGRGYFVWRDTQTEPGNAYQYRVAARFLDGSDSPLSAVASKAF
ncbi:MAG: fibronectin type III domain-containing protein [Haliscomenobacter sp.]|nr:fibronectin type III domain-containing protein [Haliscomenobacter sp.]MBP9873272.1 fibronectin type III domain-containing protein [Haliscomenobacter sp.]